MAGWGVAALSAAYGDAVNTAIDVKVAVSCMLVVLPAALAGAWEDVTQEVSILLRFGMTMLSAALACWLLDLQLGRLGIPYVDGWLAAMPAAGILLAFFALCGAPACLQPDRRATTAWRARWPCSSAWRWCMCARQRRPPAGRPGHLLGRGHRRLPDLELSARLDLRGRRRRLPVGRRDRGRQHCAGATPPLVSPWFPLLLLIYPVCETLFSIYRKLAAAPPRAWPTRCTSTS
jgi:hypothetical protein